MIILGGNNMKNNDTIVNDIYNQISDIITNNKNKMIYQINSTLVKNNFMINIRISNHWLEN